MGDWKNTTWQEKLKNKSVRLWIRDEIEEIVKEEQIDRARFGEYSKREYQKVRNKLYYTFCDYEKYPTVNLSYMWLRFRQGIVKQDEIICRDWNTYISKLQEWVPAKVQEQKLFMIVNGEWVYEGYLPEIVAVLQETDGLLEEFYIAPKTYDWVIVHSDDAQCMCFMWGSENGIEKKGYI